MKSFSCDTLTILSSTVNITPKKASFTFLLLVVAFTPHALTCVFFTQLTSCLIYLSAHPPHYSPGISWDK